MASLTPEQRKELLRKGFNLSRIEAAQPEKQEDEAPTIRTMTEEERKRLPYVRDASDPLAWGEEPSVEEDETTWDVLGAVGAGAAMARRFAKGLSKKAADVAAAKAARSAAQGARTEDTIARLRQGKEALRGELGVALRESDTLRRYLDRNAERIQGKRRKIEELRNKYRDRNAYSQGLAEDLEEKRGLVRDLRRQNDTEVDTLRGRNEYIRELEDTVEDKRRRLQEAGTHTPRRFKPLPPRKATDREITMDDLTLGDPTDVAPDSPEIIRRNMKRNIAEAGRKDLPEDFKEGWRTTTKGRPWPDFVSAGGGVPLEHKGVKYRLGKWGDVFDERGNRILRMGVDPDNPRGVTSTDFTYYEGNEPGRGSKLSGLAQAARKKLAEIHGTVTSDYRGTTSQLAQQSWERTPGAIRRTAPRHQGGIGGPQFVLRHPEGGAIRKIVDELKREEPELADYYDKSVEAWLKKYGGNVALGAAGLESLRNYLQDVTTDLRSKK